MHSAAALPLAIFSVTYLALAAGRLPLLRLDRTGAAVVGAVAMVLSGALSPAAAERAIDFPTLALLFGMMIVVANLKISGAFGLFARRLLGGSQSPVALLAMTVLLAGVLAAFFINDVVCLVMAPVLIEAAVALQLNPVPLLIALATASNIGSAATITGNPQNMIVAGFAHLSYAHFALMLALAAMLGLVVAFAIIWLVYRDRLTLHSPRSGSRIAPSIASVAGETALAAAARTRSSPMLPALMIKSSLITAGTLIGFAAGFPTYQVALGAGAVLLMTRRVKPARIYREIDWTLLLMFAGLFVVVAGAEASGFQNSILGLFGSSRLAHTTILATVVALVSNLVSNVPAVLLFRPIYFAMGASPRIALVLASASTFAGNLTVLGSIANLIVIEQARRKGVQISFTEYLKVGLPITIATIAIDVALLHFGI